MEVKENMKTLKQLKGKSNVKKIGGKKIEFQPIAKKIIESGNYYSVSEVWKHKNMVNKIVSRFRTMKLLNNQLKGRRMMRILEKGTFYYGRFDETYYNDHK